MQPLSCTTWVSAPPFWVASDVHGGTSEPSPSKSSQNVASTCEHENGTVGPVSASASPMTSMPASVIDVARDIAGDVARGIASTAQVIEVGEHAARHHAELWGHGVKKTHMITLPSVPRFQIFRGLSAYKTHAHLTPIVRRGSPRRHLQCRQARAHLPPFHRVSHRLRRERDHLRSRAQRHDPGAGRRLSQRCRVLRADGRRQGRPPRSPGSSRQGRRLPGSR